MLRQREVGSLSKGVWMGDQRKGKYLPTAAEEGGF